jgi:dipeptidyl aminopeptidase/acylaminoacyl peptidase
MRRYSPVNRAEQISSPILLTAGLKDQVTGHQQVRDFEAAARAAGKEISAHYFEQGGHSLQRWQDRLARARLVEDFLAQHLGGRSGRFDYAELGRYFSD